MQQHAALPLGELPLSARDQACCRRAGVRNAAQVLCTPTTVLQTSLGKLLDADGIARVHRAAVVEQAPKLTSVLDMLKKDQDQLCTVSSSPEDCIRLDRGPQDVCFTTGDSAIDTLLGGGLYQGALTEIVGESATGKTHFALQAAVFAALAFDVHITSRQAHRCEGVTTDDVFDALQGQGIRSASHRRSVVMLTSDGSSEVRMILRRMQDMCDALVEDRWLYARRNSQNGGRQNRSAFAETEVDRMDLADVQHLARQQLLANVHFSAMKSFGMLLHTLEYDVPALLKASSSQASRTARLGLLIVDDVTAIIRSEAGRRVGSSEFVIERSRLCCELSDTLKSLGAHSLAVVVINHVFSVLDRHKDLLRASIERRLDKVCTLDTDTMAGEEEQDKIQQEATSHIITPPGRDPCLNLVYHELDFAGIAAHVHHDAVRLAGEQVRAGKPRSFVVDSLLYGIRSASMGLSWVNSINVRIMLVRSPRMVTLSSVSSGGQARRQQRHRQRQADLPASHRFGVRRCVAVLNPFARAGCADTKGLDYIISADGVQSLQTLGVGDIAVDALLPSALYNQPDAVDAQNEEDSLWASLDDGENVADAEVHDWLTQAEQAAQNSHIPCTRTASSPSSL